MNNNNNPVSLFRKRWNKFRSLKRGYYSFIFIISCYLLSFILPIFVGRSALIVKYKGEFYFPVFKYYSASFFNPSTSENETSEKKILQGEANYRLLKKQFMNDGKDNLVILPLYPFGPEENLLSETEGKPPHKPSLLHFFGTDDRGRDVFSRLLYGFRVSMTFALLVTSFAYIIGIIFGAVLGYFGGVIDIIGQRFIEIWSTLPFLYVIIIISSVFTPNFLLLSVILTIFGWMGISYYIRGEFYREKARDYVLAAYVSGAGSGRIMLRHILPNSLTPVISFAPFAIVGNISSLVALDYLGFGLPPPTPSWGELINQGMQNIDNWWLVVFPLSALFLTLLLIVMIGEAIREAVDPKIYSRLR